jgi:probable F420-dependent oxidoreductase
MQLGVVLPAIDIGGDPIVLRDFAQAVEGLGYAHLAVPDHVLGANVASRPDWTGGNTSDDLFHDCLVLLGYLAGQTRRIVLTTQVLILPQRQTALVAKQAASVDVLCGGRLRLGIGLGWNEVEYVALNQDFHDRGVRSAEQVALMRALWTRPHVTFKGRWHEVPDAGINPLPVQRPIPVWFGGFDDRMLRRIAALADGWVANAFPPGAEAGEALDRLAAYSAEAGRAAPVPIDAWTSMGGRGPEAWRAELDGWKAHGAGHATLTTAFQRRHYRRIEGRSVDAHMRAVRDYMEAVRDLL